MEMMLLAPLKTIAVIDAIIACWISDGLHLSMIFKALVFPGIQHFMNA